jgi:hypothetical protein
MVACQTHVSLNNVVTVVAVVAVLHSNCIFNCVNKSASYYVISTRIPV